MTITDKDLARILSVLDALEGIIPAVGEVIGIIVGWFKYNNPTATSAEIRARLRLRATTNIVAVDEYLLAHPDPV